MFKELWMWHCSSVTCPVSLPSQRCQTVTPKHRYTRLTLISNKLFFDSWGRGDVPNRLHQHNSLIFIQSSEIFDIILYPLTFSNIVGSRTLLTECAANHYLNFFSADYPVYCVGFVNDRTDHCGYLFLRLSPTRDQPTAPEPSARLHRVRLCRRRHGPQHLHRHVPRYLDRASANTSANATNSSNVNLKRALKSL